MISYCRSASVVIAGAVGVLAIGVLVLAALIYLVGPFRLLVLILACGWIPVLLRRSQTAGGS